MMPIAYTRKTATALRVLTITQLQNQVRDTLGAEDEVLDRYCAAAQEWVEQYTGRSLLEQTWQMSLETWASQLWLPRAAPLSEVTFVKYYDTSNVLQTLSTSVYTVPAFHEPACILLADTQTWPALYARADAVRVEYVTGWAAAEDVPAPLVQACALLVGHWFANRETTVTGTISSEIQFAATALCAPYRVWCQEPVAA